MLERPCTLLQQFKVPTDHQKLMRKIKTFYISSRKFSAHVSTYHALPHGDNDANASSRIIPRIRVHTDILPTGRQVLSKWSVQRIEIAYHVAPKLRRITRHSLRSSPPLTTSRHTQNQPQEKTKRNGKIVVANSHGSLSKVPRESR
jgi:hypothetical protein